MTNQGPITPDLIAKAIRSGFFLVETIGDKDGLKIYPF